MMQAQTQFLGMMETETSRMMRLVQDLLSLSRVESEERVKPDERVDLLDILSDARIVLDAVAEEKGVDLRFPKLVDPVWVAGDRDQLTQVFRNLVENAVKYGNSKVSVEVNLFDHEPYVRRPAVVVDVRDDGDEIEPHHVPRLTEGLSRGCSPIACARWHWPRPCDCKTCDRATPRHARIMTCRGRAARFL